MTLEPNSPTKGDAIKLASSKETVKLQRPDLGINLEIKLDASGEEPVWHLTGTFTKLEAAIRFIQKW